MSVTLCISSRNACNSSTAVVVALRPGPSVDIIICRRSTVFHPCRIFDHLFFSSIDDMLPLCISDSFEVILVLLGESSSLNGSSCCSLLIILIIFRSANTSIFVSMAFIRKLKGEKFLLVHAETVEQWVIGAGDLEGMVVDLLGIHLAHAFLHLCDALDKWRCDLAEEVKDLGFDVIAEFFDVEECTAHARAALDKLGLSTSAACFDHGRKIHPCWMRMAASKRRFFSTTPSAAHFARAWSSLCRRDRYVSASFRARTSRWARMTSSCWRASRFKRTSIFFRASR